MRNVHFFIKRKKHITDNNDNERNHPERLAVLPYCSAGRGLDIGCGYRKTSDNCIGVDIVPMGSYGAAGNVKNQISQADICTSGDDLHMFGDNEMDFIVARHNLEHYIDIIKTLKEWRRVIKKGGYLAVILPDEDGLRAVGKRGIALDPTHEHSFTKGSFEQIMTLLGGFEIIALEDVVPNWSFLCVCKKV